MTMPAQLSTPEEREKRRHVGVLEHRVTNVANMEYPGIYPGEENTWDLELFRKVCYPLRGHWKPRVWAMLRLC